MAQDCTHDYNPLPHVVCNACCFSMIRTGNHVPKCPAYTCRGIFPERYLMRITAHNDEVFTKLKEMESREEACEVIFDLIEFHCPFCKKYIAPTPFLHANNITMCKHCYKCWCPMCTDMPEGEVNFSKYTIVVFCPLLFSFQDCLHTYTHICLM